MTGNITHAANVIYEMVNGIVVRIWLYTDYPPPFAPAPPAVPAPIPTPLPLLEIWLTFCATSIVVGILVWWYGFRK